MESRDLGTLDLASVLYVTLGKPLHCDHPVCYIDKVRPYRQFSVPFLLIFVGKSQATTKKKFQNVVTRHNESLVLIYTNIRM